MSDDIKKTQQIGHGIATPANGTGIPEAYVHKGYQFKESGRAPLPGGEKFFEIKHPEGHKEEVIARDHAAVGKMIDQIHRKKHMEKSQKCLKCQQMHNLKKNCWERYDVRKSEDLEKATIEIKPHPSDIADLSPEQVADFKSKMEYAPAQIGETKSGKSVHDAGVHYKGYAKFDADDHKEAAAVHEKEAMKLRDKHGAVEGRNLSGALGMIEGRHWAHSYDHTMLAHEKMKNLKKSEDLEKATLDMEGMDNKEPDAANGFYAEMKRRSAAMDEMDTKYNRNEKCMKCSQDHDLTKRCWDKDEVTKAQIKDMKGNVLANLASEVTPRRAEVYNPANGDKTPHGIPAIESPWVSDKQNATRGSLPYVAPKKEKAPEAFKGKKRETKSDSLFEMDKKLKANPKADVSKEVSKLGKADELEKGRIKDAVVGAATAAAIATTGASMVHDQVHATKFAMDSQAKAKKIAAPAAPKSAEQANEKPGRSWNQLKKEEMEKGLKQDLTAGLALGASVIAVHGAQTSHSGAQAAQVATQTGQRMTQETIEPVKNEHIDAASPDRKLANMRDRLSTIRQNINKPKPPKK